MSTWSLLYRIAWLKLRKISRESSIVDISDALRDFVPFVQFKKHEHPRNGLRVFDHFVIACNFT